MGADDSAGWWAGLAGLALVVTLGPVNAASSDTLGGAGLWSLGLEYQQVDGSDLDYEGGTLRRQELGLGFEDAFPLPGDRLYPGDLDSSRVWVRASLGPHPRVDVFARLGVADLDWDAREVEPGFSDDRYRYSGDRDFAWGLGLRAKLWEGDAGLRLLGRVEYTRIDSDGKARVNGQDLAAWAAADLIEAGAEQVHAQGWASSKLSEWDFSLLLAKTWGQWSPYAGLRYQHLDLDTRLRVSGSESGDTPFARDLRQEFSADQGFGGVLGLDFALNQRFGLNLELALDSGTSFSGVLDWQF